MGTKDKGGQRIVQESSKNLDGITDVGVSITSPTPNPPQRPAMLKDASKNPPKREKVEKKNSREKRVQASTPWLKNQLTTGSKSTLAETKQLINWQRCSNIEWTSIDYSTGRYVTVKPLRLVSKRPGDPAAIRSKAGAKRQPNIWQRRTNENSAFQTASIIASLPSAVTWLATLQTNHLSS